MPNPIPPPGPERDAEIMKGLGWQPTIIGRGYFLHGVEDITHWKRPDGSQTSIVPPYSTDPAAADRLVEEMVRRGWWHRYEIGGATRPGEAWFSREPVFDGGDPDAQATGGSRADAVSAAALLALRGAT